MRSSRSRSRASHRSALVAFGRALLVVGLIPVVLAGCGGDGGAGKEPTAASSPEAIPGSSVMATIDSPARRPADGVTVAGRVVGEETGEPVPSAYVVVLEPGVPFERWESATGEETETLIHTAVRADSAGAYRLPSLPRGHHYTVMIAARGYKSAAFDLGLTVEADAPAVKTMDTVSLEPAIW